MAHLLPDRGIRSDDIVLRLVRVPNCNRHHNQLNSTKGTGGPGVRVADTPFEQARRRPGGLIFGMRPADYPNKEVNLTEWKAGSMPCIKPAPLVRTNVFGPASCVILDLDGAAELTRERVDQITSILTDAGVAFSLWETVSSRRGDNPPKAHLLVPVSGAAVTPDIYREACLELASAVGLTESDIDTKCARVEQPIAIPCRGDARPFDCWSPGHPWLVSREDVDRWSAAATDRSRSRGWESERREIEDQSDTLRAFNERVADEGLTALNQYSDVTGCRFEPDSEGWHWVAVADSPVAGYSAGDSGTDGHIRHTTDDPYRFSDFGNGPLTARSGGATSLFAHEILVRQAAWHNEGLTSLSDTQWHEARDTYLNPILFPDSRPVQAAEWFNPLSDDASELDRTALTRAIFSLTYLNDKGARVWDVALSERTAAELCGLSATLRTVVRDEAGVVYRVQADGALTPYAGRDDERSLSAELRNEIFQGAQGAAPIVRWVDGEPVEEEVRAPTDIRPAVLEHMVRTWLADPRSLIEPPKISFLRRCAQAWRAAGGPEPETLFDGVIPGSVRQDEWGWAVWKRMWLTVAEVGLHPGTDRVKTLTFLVGGSNAGKSQLLEAMSGRHVSHCPPHTFKVKDEEFFTGGEGSRGSSILDCSSALVVELGEMQAALSSVDVSRRMKSFVTQSEYSVVPKFMGGVTLPRSFAVFATANNGHNGNLIPADEGSARRYMVVEMVSREDAEDDSSAAQAYAALSQLVSPESVASGRAGHLEEMMLGWAAAQVLEAQEHGTLFELLDQDFIPGGRYYDEAVCSQSRYLSGQELRTALISCDKGVTRGDQYYLSTDAVRQAAGLAHRISGAKLHELEAHTKALGGEVLAAGQMVRVPLAARETKDDILALLTEVEAAAARI